MTSEEWDAFVAEHFVGQFAGQASDFCAWMRLHDVDRDHPWLVRLFEEWSRSRRRGRHGQILDRKRRQTFGPGKYHAASSAGVFLNKSFVKGWRGINPRNP